MLKSPINLMTTGTKLLFMLHLVMIVLVIVKHVSPVQLVSNGHYLKTKTCAHIRRIITTPAEAPTIVLPEIDMYKQMTKTISEFYPTISPYILQSVIWHESRYDTTATNGSCVGLMQISTYWHKERARRLGITNFFDPYSNIMLGADLLSELLETTGDIKLTLMLYNMKHDDAYALYKRGIISDYANSVLDMAEELEFGGE